MPALGRISHPGPAWSRRLLARSRPCARWPSSTAASTARAQPPRRPTPCGPGGGCRQGSLSKQEAIDQLHEVRLSIDRTLRLLDAGDREAAFAEARSGYLDCFEGIEAPLDVVAGVDFRFAGRGHLRPGARPDRHRRADRRGPRPHRAPCAGLIDDSERQLTAKGIGAPALAFGQSFTLLLREGLEAVLLLSVLLTYLESSHHARQKKPILIGVGLAVVATVITFFAVDALFSVLPFGREVLEAVVGLLAVAMLFYVSFWLIARLDQRRRMEFLQARVWKAASVGSATSLALVGFTAVYREGFETVLFYQALFSFGEGLQGWIFAGMAVAIVVLGGGRLGGPQDGPQAAGEALPHRRARDRDAHVGRRARQRHAGAAGGRHPRSPLPGQLAEPADLPGAGHRATTRRCRASLAQGILLVVYLVGAIVTYGYAARRKAGARALRARLARPRRRRPARV